MLGQKRRGGLQPRSHHVGMSQPPALMHQDAPEAGIVRPAAQAGLQIAPGQPVAVHAEQRRQQALRLGRAAPRAPGGADRAQRGGEVQLLQAHRNLQRVGQVGALPPPHQIQHCLEHRGIGLFRAGREEVAQQGRVARLYGQKRGQRLCLALGLLAHPEGPHQGHHDQWLRAVPGAQHAEPRDGGLEVSQRQ